MPKLKPGTVYPTAREDTAINAGIAADPDNPEWTADEFARSRPASELLPHARYVELVAARPRGRPKAKPGETKVSTAIRLDADLLAAFKSYGKGWQTRINEALREQLAITMCLDEKTQIYARFPVPGATAASTSEEALGDILSRLQNQGTIRIYPVVSGDLTVKGRIPLGNNHSVWVFRFAKRIAPASEGEIQRDRLEILRVLKRKGITCNWAEIN